MPTSTIPYDPSLVLGMVVDPSKIKVLEDIAEKQKPVDAARDRVNALLRQKLSLDMTSRELLSLGVTPDQLKDFDTNLQTVMQDILSAAIDLSSAVITAESAIAKVKSDSPQQQISSQVQSPIDFSASQLQAMPLSSDTMSMDVQYFRYEDENDNNSQTSNAISSFVGAKVSSFLGASWGANAAAAATKAVTSAQNNHNLVGTVVICANCTHKQAQVFSPLVIDPDSAIENYTAYTTKAWEETDDPDAMLKLANQKVQPPDPKNDMPVLVGATFGSSFVGFVHFEKITDSSSSSDSSSKDMNASVQIKAGMFLGGSTGSFGIDKQTASSVQELLSNDDIQSHCSVITMGLIPSIKSNTVTTVLQKLQGDPQSRMKDLAAMQSVTNTGSSNSMSAMASAAKTGATFEQMKTDYISAAVASVGDLDAESNKVIDMNSLMTALDDFIDKATNGEGGVPINFYIKYISQRTIANAWMQKYYPDLLHQPVDPSTN